MIQIDMPMPKSCHECPMCNEYLMCAIPVEGKKWGENGVCEFDQSRPEWCPLTTQEAVEPKVIRMNDFGHPVHACGKCGLLITESMNYCSECGRYVLWEGR